MKQSITVNPNELLAVSLTAANIRDLRYHLQGVALEVKSKEAFIVAADGIKLSALSIGGCDTDDIIFIIPSSLIKNIKKKTARDPKLVVISYDKDTEMVTLAQSGQLYTASALDGVYPSWRRMTPKGFVPSFNFYNIQQFDVFSKASTLLDATPTFYHNAEGLGVVHVTLKDGRIYQGLLSMYREKGIEATDFVTPLYN